MKTLLMSLAFACLSLLFPTVVLASEAAPLANFIASSSAGLSLLAGSVSAFFLVKGGYLYMTSQGSPDALNDAKKTIKNALIGLAIVLLAATISSILSQSFYDGKTPVYQEKSSFTDQSLKIEEEQVTLVSVLKDLIIGLLKDVVSNAVDPIISQIINLLTITPSIANNPAVFNFWLKMVGIVDALFVFVIIAIGFQFMSASTFGFDEVEIRKVLPKLGLAFVLANISIFLVDWVVSFVNVLSLSVTSKESLTKGWLDMAFNPKTFSGDNLGMITLIFAAVFVVIASILLLSYVTRLIVIVLGAVLSPFVFLLWCLPKFSDFAEMATRMYLVSVFSVFIHVVIIYLAASFVEVIPDSSGGEQIMSVVVSIGLVTTLLKVQTGMVQMMFHNTGRSLIKNVGGQIMNVMSPAPVASSVVVSKATVKSSARKNI